MNGCVFGFGWLSPLQVRSSLNDKKLTNQSSQEIQGSMSSFKRKGSAKEVNLYPGTRSSPVSPSTVITSTGIPSLDDILGGGLPLSCSLLVAAPDFHSSYGILVQKYFVAQGLDFGHRLCIIEDNAEGFAKDIMWVPRSRTTAPEASAGSEEEQKSGDQEDQKIKIAWRYESMKPFQTTVPSSSSYVSSSAILPDTRLTPDFTAVCR